MSRRELDSDLDSYLSKRRKSIQLMAEEVRMSPEIEIEEEPKRSWLSRWLGWGDDEVVEEVREEKPDFDEVSVRSMVDSEQLKTDLKEVARISLAAFKDLPPDRLTGFKASPDFEKFKDILRRNNIIK